MSYQGSKEFRIAGVKGNLWGKVKKAGGKRNPDGSWTVSLYSDSTLFNYDHILTFTQVSKTPTKAQKEKAFDDLYNEGGEGYNPFRK